MTHDRIEIISESCGIERINGVQEITASCSEEAIEKARNDLLAAEKAGLLAASFTQEEIKRAKPLPADAVRLSLTDGEIVLQPARLTDRNTSPPRVPAAGGQQYLDVRLEPQAGCSPGLFIGLIEPTGTIKAERPIPFILMVPSRLTIEPEEIRLTVRKPGFLAVRDTAQVLSFKVTTRAGNQHSQSLPVRIDIKPTRHIDDPPDNIRLGVPQAEIVQKISVGSAEAGAGEIRVVCPVPAYLPPGDYGGMIWAWELEAPDRSAARAFYVIRVLPSAWEEVKPLAITILTLLALSIIVALIVKFRS